MNILVNKAHFPVTVLGPGQRIGIWMQGCSIGCKGCVSRDTWPADPGRAMTVAALVAWCREASGGRPDGITLSGGEPFDQPRALAALLDALILWRQQDGPDFDLLCYSGYPLATLRRRHARLLERHDAIIPEPFAAKLPLTHLWRGSANQPLVPLSARGSARYAPFLDAPAGGEGKRMQLAVDRAGIWFAGIPGRGDMEALERACAERGVSFDQASWRP